MTTTTIQTPSDRLVHAGGKFSPSIAPFRRAGHAIWCALEGIGRTRARAELERLAAVHADVDPEFAARLRESARQLG